MQINREQVDLILNGMAKEYQIPLPPSFSSVASGTKTGNDVFTNRIAPYVYTLCRLRENKGKGGGSDAVASCNPY